MEGYTSAETITTFLQQLLREPPNLILNHGGTWLDSEYYAVTSDQINHLVAEVEGDYVLVKTLGDWNVYQHK